MIIELITILICLIIVPTAVGIILFNINSLWLNTIGLVTFMALFVLASPPMYDFLEGSHPHSPEWFSKVGHWLVTMGGNDKSGVVWSLSFFVWGVYVIILLGNVLACVKAKRQAVRRLGKVDESALN
ncbi:hypothetical protein EQG49_12995 [Periweissella cryptocerci]|uniref:Uncharacterized protein n=1 Tax=Periweissella cryptocerci TaxID=2506420 RepID=A0A4P6YWS2_9LACO|nr:hypothetical protein [Periweissella cryptocerci]QBO37312.1 hypothetical protein EQG49_12995 [Periweissella cryptocerci]